MVHVANVIRYILVFIVNLLLLLFLHSYFNFVLLIVLIVLPICSVIAALLAQRYMSIEVGGGFSEIQTDDRGDLLRIRLI